MRVFQGTVTVLICNFHLGSHNFSWVDNENNNFLQQKRNWDHTYTRTAGKKQATLRIPIRIYVDAKLWSLHTVGSTESKSQYKYCHQCQLPAAPKQMIHPSSPGNFCELDFCCAPSSLWQVLPEDNDISSTTFQSSWESVSPEDPKPKTGE